MKKLMRYFSIAVATYVVACALTACMQRKLVFFPTHNDSEGMAKYFGLKEWRVDDALIGFVREGTGNKRVWLFLHGNAGQAVDRGYSLPCFPAEDSVYILEYPGYGKREGAPSEKSFNRAAEAAYAKLQTEFPERELCVLGESLGTGASCHLGTLPKPPARIVLMVPFDRITEVAQEKVPFIPVGMLMLDRWDNIAALRQYKGRVDIYGARWDVVIPVEHARRLAAAIPGAKYHEMECGHNEWNLKGLVELRD